MGSQIGSGLIGGWRVKPWPSLAPTYTDWYPEKMSIHRLWLKALHTEASCTIIALVLVGYLQVWDFLGQIGSAESTPLGAPPSLTAANRSMLLFFLGTIMFAPWKSWAHLHCKFFCLLSHIQPELHSQPPCQTRAVGCPIHLPVHSVIKWRQYNTSLFLHVHPSGLILDFLEIKLGRSITSNLLNMFL